MALSESAAPSVRANLPQLCAQFLTLSHQRAIRHQKLLFVHPFDLLWWCVFASQSGRFNCYENICLYYIRTFRKSQENSLEFLWKAAAQNSEQFWRQYKTNVRIYYETVTNALGENVRKSKKIAKKVKKV